MLRLKRMKPHGRSALINSRSSAVSSAPDTPVMKARMLIRADYPCPARGSRKRPLISLDEAGGQACGFQIVASLRRLFGRSIRPSKGAVDDSLALVGEINPLDHRRAGPEHAAIFALKHPVGGVCAF